MQLVQFHETKMALGGDATIVIVANQHRDMTAIFNELWRVIFTFEKQFSRFLPQSELSQFNTRAGLWVPISDEFADLLKTTIKLSQFTGSLYNPFILPALQRSGYTHSAAPGYEADRDQDYRHRAVVPIDKLTVRDNQACIPYGTAFDLGGCGKGYLADTLADLLDDAGFHSYWISLSGDMVTSGHDEHGSPWRTVIQNAYSDQIPAPVFVQTDGSRHAVATSGTLRRVNQKLSGKHHIIDPSTGLSAKTDIRLATVVTTNATEADVLASCAVLTGSKDSEDFLRARRVEAGYIQTTQSETMAFGQYLHTASEVTYA
ncbi:FAD:protein FMN transferase [Candidatus Saccharibacteria bacterium]|nr:FAD:protein FMN transferase [Candidatus Saccharibacteria bacterium]